MDPLTIGMVGGGILQGLSGLFGSRSASRSRQRAEQLQREQIQSARDYQGQAQQAYGARDPLREMFMQRLMGFRGSPENPFAAPMFGGSQGQLQGLAGKFGAAAAAARGMSGRGLPPQATPGAPGAFNPYPQFGPGQNLIQSQITPTIDRSALDALRGILGVNAGG